MTDRPLQLDDIQGNILAGFNTDVEVLLALTVSQSEDFPRAAQWLAAQAESVTVVSEVRDQRDIMKSGQPDVLTTWLCVAVGQRLLKATLPDVLIRDDAFNGGMLKRAPSVLGDKTDPKAWRVGGSAAPVDVLLIIAANNEMAAAERADDLSASAASSGLITTYREIARRLGHNEQFGFRDGISQPKVIGDDPDGELGAGHFVFGYPQQVGAAPFSPVIDPRGLTDNGSLLVFRRLVQDVRVFRQFCADEAARIEPQWPGLTPDHLAALLVGRWPSGAPVRAGQVQDPGGSVPDNGFHFQDDQEGRSCPFGAHIRKVNPRKDPNRDVVNVPRMLRRGITFGPSFEVAPNEKDRGLAFLAFQTSVKAQFEFLTRTWMNSDLNPRPGSDLLVGRSGGTRSMKIIGPNGPIEVSVQEKQWIIPTGGAYLFAPSRSALKRFATPSAPIGLWKAKQLLAKASHAIRTSLFD